jgi:hypothetical protein
MKTDILSVDLVLLVAQDRFHECLPSARNRGCAPFKRHGLADSVPLLPQNAAKSDSLLLWRMTAIGLGEVFGPFLLTDPAR